MVYKPTSLYIDPTKRTQEMEDFGIRSLPEFKGSAYNKFDIPINKKYKFQQNYKNLNQINFIIHKILKNYKTEVRNFKNYKKKILNEEKLFKKQLLKIFFKQK